MGVNLLLEIRSEIIWRKAFTSKSDLWRQVTLLWWGPCLDSVIDWFFTRKDWLDCLLTSTIYQQSVGSGSKKASAPTNVQSTTSSNSQGFSLKNAEKLEVTIIPVDDMPYSKIIQIPHSLLGKSQDIVNSMQGHLNTLPRIKPTFRLLSSLVQRKLQVLRQRPLLHQHKPHIPV